MQVDFNNFEIYGDIYLFIEVIKAGGINKAARQLNLQPSKISRRIKMLESELKKSLLTRSANTLELTGFGSKVYNLFKSDYLSVHDKLSGLVDDNNEFSGAINLFIPPVFAQKIIAGDLDRFLEEYPQLQINFYAFNFLTLYNYPFDLAVSTRLPERDNYLVRKLYSCRKVLFASPKYILKHGIPSSIVDLTEHKFLVEITDGVVFNTINLTTRNDDTCNFVINNCSLTFDNMLYGLEMLLHGYGICALPEFMAKPYLNKGELVHLLPQYISDEFSFYLIRSNAKITKKESEVVKFLQHVIEQNFDADNYS